MKQYITGLTIVLVSILLTACGGGGGGASQLDTRGMQSGAVPTSTTPSADTTTDQGSAETEAETTKVMSTGVITGFGSVFVNGVEFETGSAQVTTDDEEVASENDLQVGMVVMVTGTINEDGVTGEASDIEYSENLQGSIQTINLSDSSFTVLDQTIITDELTNFEGEITLETLEVGQLVEVSGMLNADGAIVASLVKLEDPATSELKVEGVVSNLNAENSLFELNGLVVNYALADIEDIDQLIEGVYVRVRSSQDLVEGVLQADKIVVKGTDDGAAAGAQDPVPGSPVVIDGIIDSFESLSSFTVNGEQALVNELTNFLSGSSSADLILNARVRIKGTLDDAGVIVVEHLTLQTRNFLGMEGEIQSIDLVNHSLTMLGITFLVNEETHFIDSGPERIKYFSLADLLVGDWVEIMARETELETEYVAVKLKRHRDQESEQMKLSGPISAIDPLLMQFSINGFVVQVADMTEIEFDHGDAMDMAALFELLVDGLKVKIEGVIEGEMVIAAEISIKRSGDHGKSADAKPGDSTAGDDDDSQGNDKGAGSENGKGSGNGQAGGNGNGKDKDKDKDPKSDAESDAESEDETGEDAGDDSTADGGV